MALKYFNACFFLCSSLISADGISTPDLPEKVKPIVKPGTSGIEIFHAHYRFSGDVVYKNTRNYFGVRIQQEHIEANDYYSAFESVFAVGVNKIRQHRFIGDFERVKNNLDQTAQWFDVDLKYGYTFQPALAKNFLLSVFTGPGFHTEADDMYRASWYYGLAGIRAIQAFSEKFTMGIDLKTTYSFGLKDLANMTAVSRFGHENFWGIEVGMPMIWQIGTTNRFDIRCKPYLLKLNVSGVESIVGSTVEIGYSF